MGLTDILKLVNNKFPLAALDKTPAIVELIDLLDAIGALRDAAKLGSAVLERESTRSTGYGTALAIAHGKTDGVDQVVMAIGRTGAPIEVGAIDGKPVELLWLLSSPTDKTGPHITALGRVSKIMSNPAVRRRMLSARSAAELYDIIVEQDELI